MPEPNEVYDESLVSLIKEAASHELHTDAATTAMKNLETFSKVRPPTPEPEPIPDPVPETAWGRFACGASRVLDNETTRTIIKAAGAFGGVALVTYSTIKRDHVVERQALQQANQRPS